MLKHPLMLRCLGSLLLLTILLGFTGCGHATDGGGALTPVNDSTVAFDASFIYVESFCGAEAKHLPKDSLLPLSGFPLALVHHSRHDTVMVRTDAQGHVNLHLLPGAYGVYLARPGNPAILGDRRCDWWFGHCFATITVTSRGAARNSFLLTFPCHACD